MAKKKPQAKDLTVVIYVLLAVTIVLASVAQVQIHRMGNVNMGTMMTGAAVADTGSSGNSLQDAINKIIPKGEPAVYGSELGVTFDDPVNSLNIMAPMDADLYGENRNGLSLRFSDLTDEQKTRYMKIGSSIACEFCCGVKTLISSNGMPSCGCAHSAAMRALTKYLLINHGAEYTDQQILDELVKWKTMFFPKQMTEKYLQQQAQEGKIDASVLSQIPDMVGGC